MNNVDNLPLLPNCALDDYIDTLDETLKLKHRVSSIRFCLEAVCDTIYINFLTTNRERNEWRRKTLNNKFLI